MEAAKKQNRSFEDGKNGEGKGLGEEVETLRSKVKRLESEYSFFTPSLATSHAPLSQYKTSPRSTDKLPPQHIQPPQWVWNRKCRNKKIQRVLPTTDYSERHADFAQQVDVLTP